MINIYEENINYLRDLCDDEELNQVMESAKFPNSFIYNFWEVIDDFNIMSFELYEEMYSDVLGKNVLIYKIQHSNADIAFLTQLFDVPDVPDCFETRFAMFISEEMTEDEIFYKHVVGHEIAHLDFFDLPEFDDHEFQERYPFIEAYCDLKSLEIMNKDNDTDKYYALVRMMDNIKENVGEYMDDVDTIREYEIRSKFMRLAIKGKLTSKMVANYINKNYIRHMEYLSNNVVRYEKFSKTKFKAIDLTWEAFCYQERMERCIRESYYI